MWERSLSKFCWALICHLLNNRSQCPLAWRYHFFYVFTHWHTRPWWFRRQRPIAHCRYGFKTQVIRVCSWLSHSFQCTKPSIWWQLKVNTLNFQGNVWRGLFQKYCIFVHKMANVDVRRKNKREKKWYWGRKTKRIQ